MSNSRLRLTYHEAMEKANPIVAGIKPYCERVEIAGSLRRKCETVGDIEIVCIPRQEQVIDMFGLVAGQRSALDGIAWPWTLIRGGDKYKQYDIGACNLDLFITTPQQWGVIFTLRTGSAEFSHKLVTKRQQGGLCPAYLSFRDGRIWNNGQAIDTPEERDVFEALGLAWIEPEER